jgi:hypothetical protein
MMHRRLTSVLASFATLASAAAQSVVPAEPPAAPPAAAAPAGKPITETLVLQSPLPTVAPAFGNVLEFAGDDLVVTGAVLPRQPGSDGQIVTFEPQTDGSWKARPQLPQVAGLMPGDFALQRLAVNADTLVTPVVRRQGSGELAWFSRVQGPEGWRQGGTIKAPPGQRRMNFGGAVAMSGDLLAVGEVSVRPNMKEADYPTCPKVYLFRRTEKGWEPQGALQRDEAKKPYWFGCSLAFDGDTLAVGYPTMLKPFRSEQNLGSLEVPMVCVYRRDGSGWKLEQEVTSKGGGQWLGFGNRIALRGDLMVVHSLNPFEDGVDVLVYRRVDGKWQAEGPLKPGAGVTSGRGFGFTLGIMGEAILVGDVSAVEGEDGAGRVFVFRRQGEAWTEVARLKPSVKCMPRSFGSGMAVKAPWVAVGHVRNEQAGIEPGGALLFKLDPAIWSAEKPGP